MSKTVFQLVNRLTSNDLMLGLSEESRTGLYNYGVVYAHYYMPVSRYNYQQEFYNLLENWRNEVQHLSSIADIAMHPSYQEIIGMGEKVVPLLLRELDMQPDHLFWALKAITGEDPVVYSQRGKLNEMKQAWFGWAFNKGYDW